ncbi:Variant surface glycoprotein [Trypanosoma congolense IL3000]|uniref:Variant surface glycoprotein n=1 Tax=Trypanosoma congolense (strain IL3000) TaxID=1068625 RepID=F9WDS0_TRYCI|nr:Variant surface glycoprotein [Trypanosoma congolense IL3000]
MMMKCWVLVMMVMSVGVCADPSGTKNHNGEEHKALCDVLKAAVGKWVRERESLSEPLKNAIKQTIFGYGGPEVTVDKLKEKAPKDYDDISGSRGLSCAQPFSDDIHKAWPLRWSGHSAPHGLVCLCTLGENGWPISDAKSEKLCGQTKDALGGDKAKRGWSDKESKHGKGGEEQIQATWTTVIKECLSNGREEDLRGALKAFIGKLNHTWTTVYENMYLLGEGNISSDQACNGETQVCARYLPNATETKTWWQDLKNALDEEEVQKKREEEERRKQQDEKQNLEIPKTEDFKSGSTTTNQTEAPKNDNLTEKLRKYNLTSGTPISMPTSWLLSATILI